MRAQPCFKLPRRKPVIANQLHVLESPAADLVERGILFLVHPSVHTLQLQTNRLRKFRGCQPLNATSEKDEKNRKTRMNLHAFNLSG